MNNFIFKAISAEDNRQLRNIELIASENFVSDDVKAALGSNFTNKYCEGYPEESSIEKFKEMFPDYVHTGKIGRYYGGCENADMIELYARYQFQKVFNTNYHVNVQPHSGSQANMAAYMACNLYSDDKILSMSLDDGGHLTHGSMSNFSGKQYHFIHYNVDANGLIDYNNIRNLITFYEPKVVVAGGSAYSREIDFKRIYDIINECSYTREYKHPHSGDDETYTYRPIFIVDMSHIAGLVAAGVHQSPFGLADIITTTTHKTLRGPRGGLIFCKPEFAKKVDSAIFPGVQGGPLMHVIAAKAVCATEALGSDFKEYIEQVVKNCRAMADEFKRLGYKIVTDGTDNHLFLIDLTNTCLTGRQVQELCDQNGITLNKNCVPNEKRRPKETSGIRIGTAPMTTKGYKEEDFIRVAQQIDLIIKKASN